MGRLLSSSKTASFRWPLFSLARKILSKTFQLLSTGTITRSNHAKFWGAMGIPDIATEGGHQHSYTRAPELRKSRASSSPIGLNTLCPRIGRLITQSRTLSYGYSRTRKSENHVICYSKFRAVLVFSKSSLVGFNKIQLI